MKLLVLPALRRPASRLVMAAVLGISAASLSAAQAETITLGSYGPATGPNAGAYALIDGLDAYLKMRNDAGGINGYTFDLKVADDQFNPALTVGGVRRLVEEDDIFAIVGPAGGASTLAVADYLLDKKIPSVVAQMGSNPDAANPYSYLLNPDGVSDGAASAKYVAENLSKNGKIGIVYQNDQVGQPFVQGADYYASTNSNVTLTKVPFQLNAVDMTPALAALKDAGVDAVIVRGAVQTFVPIFQAAESLSFHPVWFGAAYHANPAVLAKMPPAQTENMYFLTFEPPVGSPETKDFVAAMQKYYPNAKANSLALQGWVAGTIFADAFANMTAAGGKPTRDGLVAELDKFDGYTNDLIKDVTYKPSPDVEEPHIPRVQTAVMKWMGDHPQLVSAFTKPPKVPGQPGQ